MTRAEHELRNIVADLLTEAAKHGDVRGDIAPNELANYCIRALAAASRLPSKAAIRRLVQVTLAGISPRVRQAREPR